MKKKTPKNSLLIQFQLFILSKPASLQRNIRFKSAYNPSNVFARALLV